MPIYNLSDTQADAIENAIAERLGINKDETLRGFDLSSDGVVTIRFLIPRAELEDIINTGGKPQRWVSEGGITEPKRLTRIPEVE